MTFAIELCDVSKSYAVNGSEPVLALAPSNLTVEYGEFVAIIGPSGSGKSSMLAIAGLLSEPTSGMVKIEGNVVDLLRSADVRRSSIGYVFQDFGLFDHLDGLGNVLEAFRFSSMSASERHRRAIEAMESVGIAHRHDHKPQHMSGGEQQRIAIARALAKSPSVICADEPTGNLDARTTVAIVDLLTTAARKASMIMVTHDHEVASMADRILLMTQAGLVPHA